MTVYTLTKFFLSTPPDEHPVRRGILKDSTRRYDLYSAPNRPSPPPCNDADRWEAEARREQRDMLKEDERRERMERRGAGDGEEAEAGRGGGESGDGKGRVDSVVSDCSDTDGGGGQGDHVMHQQERPYNRRQREEGPISYSMRLRRRPRYVDRRDYRRPRPRPRYSDSRYRHDDRLDESDDDGGRRNYDGRRGYGNRRRDYESRYGYGSESEYEDDGRGYGRGISDTDDEDMYWENGVSNQSNLVTMVTVSPDLSVEALSLRNHLILIVSKCQRFSERKLR